MVRALRGDTVALAGTKVMHRAAYYHYCTNAPCARDLHVPIAAARADLQVMETIVSQRQQAALNKQATLGDGQAFTAELFVRARRLRA